MTSTEFIRECRARTHPSARHRLYTIVGDDWHLLAVARFLHDPNTNPKDNEMDIKLNDVDASFDTEDLVGEFVETYAFTSWIEDKISEHEPDINNWSEDEIATIAQREVRDAADDDERLTSGGVIDIFREQLDSMPHDEDSRCALGRSFTDAVLRVIENSAVVREGVASIATTVVNERLAEVAEVDAAEAAADADDGTPTVAEVDQRVVDAGVDAAMAPVMTSGSDAEVIEIMTDTAALLTWRVAAERELHRRGYRTHADNGTWLMPPEPPARVVVKVSVVTLPPNGEHAADTLRRVARSLAEAGDVGPGDGGTVWDANANVVGTWLVAPESNPDATLAIDCPACHEAAAVVDGTCVHCGAPRS